MRLRAGLVVCLCALLIAVGCRDALVPNIDTNQPPETWITAAPQDTLTRIGPDGVPRNEPGKIPVIFHLYWAGSDEDGAIAGYYFAVVETTVTVPAPRLPGPKPQDYRFTTKTDSTFIFNVSEFAPDRQHTFYIYAVDDKGRPDPTPARFHFVSADNYPPIPFFRYARAAGRVWRQMANGALFQKDTTYTFTDFFAPGKIVEQFAPAGAAIEFGWGATQQSPLLYTTGYKYKLDETSFISVDSSVTSVSYPLGATGPGPKIFTLRTIDQAGGARDSTRFFGLNLPPDTWWSGPDPNEAYWASRPKHGFSNQLQRYYRFATGAPAPTLPNSPISCDTALVMPAARPFRPTFLELWKDTLYVRSEGDTVHLNSWLIFANGGFDQDSPYSIQVSPIDPNLPTACSPTAPVIVPGPSNGSPIGFRAFVGTLLDPALNTFSQPSVTGLYPVFNPSDFRWTPRINSYQSALLSGRAYAVVRAEDGTGQDFGGLDRSIPGNLRVWTDMVDAAGTPEERLNRNKKVLTFWVNYSPFLLTGAPQFSPKLKPGGAPDTLANRIVNINLLADDIDPFDPATPIPVGAPTASKVFRFTVSFRGQTAAGRDTTVSPLDLFQLPSVNIPTYPIPDVIKSQNVTMRVQLCDCRDCETASGRGRCITQDFPLFMPPGAPQQGNASAANAHSGPGSSSARVRSNAP